MKDLSFEEMARCGTLIHKDAKTRIKVLRPNKRGRKYWGLVRILTIRDGAGIGKDADWFTHIEFDDSAATKLKKAL